MQVLRNRTALAVATLLAAMCVAAPAALAAPATVTVRVEGKNATVLPRTAVTTTTTPVNKDGDPNHTCTGTSAAGALERATSGAWSGSWFGTSYFVESIKGETPQSPDYWTFWINNRSSNIGVCDLELSQGDEVLFFVDYCNFDPNLGDCSNPPVFPLAIVDAPQRAERGKPVSVRVIRYDRQGQTAPVSGATLSGGGSSATTGADGRATLSFAQTGTAALRAEHPGFARSDTVVLCVYDASAGGCDVSAPAPTVGGQAGGPLDTRLPLVSIAGIRDRQRFSRRRAPRLLRGTVDPGAAGVHAVRFRLRRAVGRRCWFYSTVQERFRRGRCGASWFLYRVGDRPNWEYLLPARLAPGRYVLDVRVMDRWGREVTKRVRFTVRRSRG